MTDIQNVTHITNYHFNGGAPTEGTDPLANGIACCGEQNVANAGANTYVEELMKMLKEYVNQQQGMPQGVKDEINETIDNAAADGKIDTPKEAQDAVNSILQMIRESAQEDMKEISNEMSKKEGAGGTGEAQGANGSGTSGNWLVKLAKALGNLAGNHLKEMIKTQEAIADLEKSDKSDADKAGEMAELQAKMQAHTQMFKLLQEALTTIVKTIGEALSSTARKQ